MSAFDAHKNFAQSLVAVAPSPADSGTTLSVTGGEGGKFPGAPFNCTVDSGTAREIIRVTSKGSGDDWTILRAQESTSAMSISVGDNIANTITVKVVTDIEDAIPAAYHSGSKTLGSGVSSGSVTGLSLSFTPARVVLTVSRPAGSYSLIACDNAGTLTTDGFDFELSGVTDSTDYVLNYAIYA